MFAFSVLLLKSLQIFASLQIFCKYLHSRISKGVRGSVKQHRVAIEMLAFATDLRPRTIAEKTGHVPSRLGLGFAARDWAPFRNEDTPSLGDLGWV